MSPRQESLAAARGRDPLDRAAMCNGVLPARRIRSAISACPSAVTRRWCARVSTFNLSHTPSTLRVTVLTGTEQSDLPHAA